MPSWRVPFDPDAHRALAVSRPAGAVDFVMGKRLGGFPTSQVMQTTVDSDQTDPLVRIHVRLGRGARELLLTVFGLVNGLERLFAVGKTPQVPPRIGCRSGSDA